MIAGSVTGRRVVMAGPRGHTEAGASDERAGAGPGGRSYPSSARGYCYGRTGFNPFIHKIRGVLAVALLVAACSSPTTASPTTQPASTPAVTTATEEPVDEATDEPTAGSGIITFGKSYNTNTLRIIGPATSFKTSSKLIAWSAEFTEPAGDTQITLTIAKRSSGGSEKILYRLTVDLADPTGDLLANKAELAEFLDRKPGTYVMRYLRGGTILAEGSFTLVA